MNEDCLFCQIVDGEIPSRTVYEDHSALAFLDVNPLTPGHTLVIPKEHHERVGEMGADDAAAVGQALDEIAPAVEDAVNAPGSTIAYNNGEAAGQEIPHAHAHIIPRFDDGRGGSVHSLFPERPDLDDEEFDDIEADISERL